MLSAPVQALLAWLRFSWLEAGGQCSAYHGAAGRFEAAAEQVIARTCLAAPACLRLYCQTDWGWLYASSTSFDSKKLLQASGGWQSDSEALPA